MCDGFAIRTSNEKQSKNDDFLYPFSLLRRIIKKNQIYHETNQNVISRTFPYLFQIVAKKYKKKHARSFDWESSWQISENYFDRAHHRKSFQLKLNLQW